MEFNAVAEMRAFAVRAKVAGNATAFRALKNALDQVQEVQLAKIPDGKPLTKEEIFDVLGAETAE